jgi:cytochrome b
MRRAIWRGPPKGFHTGELHGAFANIAVGPILLHILGVGLASVAHRENLVAAMFSGRKRSEDES